MKSTSKARRGFGWIPDLPDQRDYLYAALHRRPVSFPSSVDLRARCSPVEDQGSLGSCTGNALAGALEFLEGKDGVQFENLSRLFIYYNERVIEQTTNTDSGAMLRAGIKTLAKQGVCSDKKWPYVVSRYRTKPSATCYKLASDHKITSYQRLSTIDDMLGCLADGFPFVFGFTVYESFQSSAVAKNGVVPMPKPNERSIGGHAVVAVGYNDGQKRFVIRNSWGTGWGQKGYFTMPYDYLADRNLSDDLWTIRRGENM